MGHGGYHYRRHPTREMHNLGQKQNNQTPRRSVRSQKQNLRPIILHIHSGIHMQKYNSTEGAISVARNEIEIIKNPLISKQSSPDSQITSKLSLPLMTNYKHILCTGNDDIEKVH